MPEISHEPKPHAAGGRLRLWPALGITALAAARLIQVWKFRDYDVQFKVEGSGGILKYWLVALALWWLVFSGISLRRRLLGVLSVAGLAGLVSLLVRVHGIDGNRIPILEWRWSRAIASSPATNAPASARPRATAAFPQFLGPNRNGVLPGPKLFPDWTARPPELLWRQPVGEGWSGFAIEGSDAISLEQDGENECIVCRDLATGMPRWRVAYAARYDNSSAGTGPRTVPAMDSERVWTTGATGILTCTTRRDGTKVWQRNCLTDSGTAIPMWGFSVSPLVIGNWVVVAPGGPEGKSLIAYDKQTGSISWTSGTDGTGYSSPVEASLLGTRQILSFGRNSVSGYDAADGRLLWMHTASQSPNVACPVAIDDRHVLISSGYGFGARLVEVKRDSSGAWSSTQSWHSIRMKSKFANLIVLNGYAYGYDDGTFACINLSDGSKVWKDGRYGHGQMLKVGEHILATTESGEIVLISPSPEALKERTRFRVLTGKTWNPPALAGDLLLVRHDREAACFRLPTE